MTFQRNRGKDLPDRAPSRLEHQHDAQQTLPRIMGMVVTLIIDDEGRTSQTGKLCRRVDGGWQVNDRAFSIPEIDAFFCAGIDFASNYTVTTIVVDEVTA